VAETPLVRALREQERGWHARPLVRELYGEWFARLGARLSRASGRSVELGAGIGKLAEVVPSVLPTDVEPTPWTDVVADAERLPYEDASLANLVLVDVFHHLPRPARFLDEATRTLVPGGRVLVLDPYCSPVSTVAYRLLHHERTDLGAPAFADDARVADDPLAANQARATLVFFRGREELARRWPGLRLVEARRLALLAYPLSGGLTGRRLVGRRLGGALARLEPRLAPLAPLLAFRCLVVLERRAAPGGEAG
jgi:SAM-dependent methyltransferase